MALRTRVLIGLVRGAWSRLVCFDRPISSPSRAPRSRPVAFLLHGAIARVVGVGLVVLPGLLERTGTARNFRLAAGPVTLGMCVLFRYRAAAAAVA